MNYTTHNLEERSTNQKSLLPWKPLLWHTENDASERNLKSYKIYYVIKIDLLLTY